MTERYADLLDAVPPDIASGLAEMGRTRRYAAGQLIHGPAAPSDSLFKIEAGTVRFRTLSASGAESDHAVLGEGHWFGDIAILSGTSPPHDAVAGSGTVLRVVPGRRFERLLAEDAALAVAIARLSCRRLVRAYAALDSFRGHDTAKLLAETLLTLAGGDGIARVTQGALAERIGRSRSTVSPLLGDWRRAGLIGLRRGEIAVLDADGLAKRSGLPLSGADGPQA